METKQIILLAAGAALLLMPVVMPVLRYLGRLLKASKVFSVKSVVYVTGGALLASAAFLSPIDSPPSGPGVEPTPVDLSGPFYAGVMYRLSEEKPVGVWEYISMRDKILVNVREQYDYRFLPAEQFWTEMLKYIQSNWENLKSEDVSNHLKMLSIQFYQKGTGDAEMDAAWEEGYGAADAALRGVVPNPPTPEPEPQPDNDTCPDCNGSGKTGDGITDCLRCDGDGKLDGNEHFEGRRVLFFYAPRGRYSLNYMQRMKASLSNDYTIGESPDCQIVLIDAVKYRDLATQCGFSKYPSFILLDGDQIIEKWTGSHKPVSYIAEFLGG